MGNYSENESACRVDIFKPSGKWVTTIVVEWNDYTNHRLHDYLKTIIAQRIDIRNFKGYSAVCLEPYSKYEHPIMIKDF